MCPLRSLQDVPFSLHTALTTSDGRNCYSLQSLQLYDRVRLPHRKRLKPLADLGLGVRALSGMRVTY